MVADTQKMTPLTDLTFDSPFFTDDYSQENNLQKGAERVASAVSFATQSPRKTFSPKHVWKKISDGFSNHQGKIIALTALVALAVLSHFVGILGALFIGAICLIFISRR
jgi:hypothetical protein